MRQILIIGAIFVLLSTSIGSAFAGESMDLREVIVAARKNPTSQVSVVRAQGAEAAATMQRRIAILPTVSVAGSANLRDRGFTLATPMGDFPIGDRFFASGRLRISQPLLDPTRLFYTSVAAKEEARAARHASVRTKDEMAMAAVHQYLDVLAVDALITANAAFIANLESRLAEVVAMVAMERAIMADQLKVELALQSAQLESLVLNEKKQLGTRALGRAVGRDSPVVPTGIVYKPTGASSGNLNTRTDLLALRSKQKAAQKRLAGVRSELLPQIIANGDLIYSDQGPQAETVFLQGSINLVWVPFAGGTRQARKEIHRAELSALRLEYEHALRGVKLQVEQSRSAMVIAKGQLDVAAKAISQSTEVVRITRERYGTGRETIADLLEAEAALRDSIAKHDIAKIEGVRARLSLALASGSL